MTERKDAERRSPEEKKKRVRAIKLGIIYVLAGWMILSLIMLFFLTAKVFSLQKQVNRITDVIESTVQMEKNRAKDGEVPHRHEAAGSETPARENDITMENALSEDNLYREGDERKVYLTFDDSPGESTGRILDILKENEVKATFFLKGTKEEALLPLYKRIAAEGHTVGMHSFSDSYSEVYQSKEAFRTDVSELSSLIEKQTGEKPKYYRFLGGSNNRFVAEDMSVFIECLKEMNIPYFDWNVSAGDATAAELSVDELVENVLSDVVKYKTSVVLLHDGADKEATVEALPALISELRKLDASILPISEETEQIRFATLAK